ncbi:MAG TPA: 30S ribosomal protein S18 [Bacteroidota bacterium]|jgi:small subunit ribosomal protein S18|nr:30S ribosomal protein S18 [Bacteroidota bacterium]
MRPIQRKPRRRSNNVAKRRPDPFHGKDAVYIDYKESKFLERFTNDQGKILPRRLTGLSAKNQRRVTEAIKRARFMALLPYVGEGLK